LLREQNPAASFPGLFAVCVPCAGFPVPLARKNTIGTHENTVPPRSEGTKLSVVGQVFMLWVFKRARGFSGLKNRPFLLLLLQRSMNHTRKFWARSPGKAPGEAERPKYPLAFVKVLRNRIGRRSRDTLLRKEESVSITAALSLGLALDRGEKRE